MNAGKALAIFASLLLSLSLTSAHLTLATEFKVSNDSACTLADAIEAANRDQAVGGCSAGNGEDTIILTGDITLDGNLPDIRSKITVTSDGSGVKHTISGAGRYLIFDVEPGNLTLKRLQLIAGRGHDVRGGAVRILEGHVTLSDVRMEDNWAERGGGALRVGNGSSAICDMCVFVDNHAPEGGAIWVGDEGTSLVLKNSVVFNNSADRGGGMFIKQGSATISGTSFSSNTAAEGPDLLSVNAELNLQPSTGIDTRNIVRR